MATAAISKQSDNVDSSAAGLSEEDDVDHKGQTQNGHDANIEKKLPTPIDTAIANQVHGSNEKTPTGSGPRNTMKEKKLGHRRVADGQVTYKKIQTSTIMGSLQLGIQQAVGGLSSKIDRDLLMQDFLTVEQTVFPCQGSSHTPAHHFTEFRFKTYAPIAFRYFRDLFGIQPQDFLMSMCNEALRELSNPGASGSVFYLTLDDEFIIKTVQHKEGEFLQKLLPGYYMNLVQNPRTLLPKFFGLYCYQCNSKNVRVCVMNNLLPSSIKLHQKYDLKGSTYKRKASKSERSKSSPTYKDLDFLELHPEGLLLEAETYSALVKAIERDCRVLESFKIMDYSLLMGVYNLDLAARERASLRLRQVSLESQAEPSAYERETGERVSLRRSRSMKQKLVAHSTAMESIQADSEPIDEEEDVPPGGIPARNAKGERLLLFIGIIDILQSYRLRKKLEHTWKSMIHDGDTVSVHRPRFYSERFQKFMNTSVFKKIQSRVGPMMSATSVLPTSTPPPAFRDVMRQGGPPPIVQRNLHGHHAMRENCLPEDPADVVSISDIKLEPKPDTRSSLSVESSSTSGVASSIRAVTWTPPTSAEGSTPTWTEGTPSFTESSSSGDLGCPTTPVLSLNTSRDSEHGRSETCPETEMVLPITV